MQKIYMKNILKGLLRSVLLTFIFILILTGITMLIEVNNNIISSLSIIFTMLSIIFGVVYATRQNNKKGWLIGLIISILYMLIIYIANFLLNGAILFDIVLIVKFFIAIAIGILSGMLAINV